MSFTDCRHSVLHVNRGEAGWGGPGGRLGERLWRHGYFRGAAPSGMDAQETAMAVPVSSGPWLATPAIRDVLLRNPLSFRFPVGVACVTAALDHEARRVVDNHT